MAIFEILGQIQATAIIKVEASSEEDALDKFDIGLQTYQGDLVFERISVDHTEVSSSYPSQSD